ncbi:hypothetical protein IVB30_02090 [Bradyrhizobium sp. 200]|uniref:hypothetical protein n=1 Tax=Bradyrhizobium sp. 200 TaxID=2782665 RepID=UPI001FFFCD39|nr:hypothetical protein [Bradyrhizobium sp. 200]UPJ50248.1 hypothetical protein IVB30_02090 [Bradyrhizobium sp. 200]
MSRARQTLHSPSDSSNPAKRTPMAKQIPNWLDGGSADDDEPGPGAIVDKRRLGHVLGLTPYAIGEMINLGMPVKRRGDKHTPWEFEVGRVMAWMVEDAVRTMSEDSDTARYREAKRAKMQAEFERLKDGNDATRRELVNIDDAVTVLRENADIVRKHLGAVPASITTALAALNPEDRRNASIVESLVDDCINAAMVAISEEGVEHAEAA